MAGDSFPDVFRMARLVRLRHDFLILSVEFFGMSGVVGPTPNASADNDGTTELEGYEN